MTDFDQSSELQFLAIMLLKEVISAPIYDEKKKPKAKDKMKQQFQKMENKF